MIDFGVATAVGGDVDDAVCQGEAPSELLPFYLAQNAGLSKLERLSRLPAESIPLTPAAASGHWSESAEQRDLPPNAMAKFQIATARQFHFRFANAAIERCQ